MVQTNHGFGLGERVVLKLARNLPVDPSSLIAFDNFFTSIPLMKALKKRGIYSCGTVRTNRKGLPSMMKTSEKLQKGEFR